MLGNVCRVVGRLAVAVTTLGLGALPALAQPHAPHTPHAPRVPPRQVLGCCALGRDTCDETSEVDCVRQGGRWDASKRCDFATGRCVAPPSPTPSIAAPSPTPSKAAPGHDIDRPAKPQQPAKPRQPAKPQHPGGPGHHPRPPLPPPLTPPAEANPCVHKRNGTICDAAHHKICMAGFCVAEGATSTPTRTPTTTPTATPTHDVPATVCAAEGIYLPRDLPVQKDCDGGAKSKNCKGWDPLVPDAEANKLRFEFVPYKAATGRDANNPGDLQTPGLSGERYARFYHWQNEAKTTKCFYLYRFNDEAKDTQTDNGVLCFDFNSKEGAKISKCNVCAFDALRGKKLDKGKEVDAAAPRWQDLKSPGQLGWPPEKGGQDTPYNCSGCHSPGPIAPMAKFFAVVQSETSAINQACVEASGPRWVNAPTKDSKGNNLGPPHSWLQNNNAKRGYEPTTAKVPDIGRCIDCHLTGFVTQNGLTNPTAKRPNGGNEFCGVVQATFGTGGAMLQVQKLKNKNTGKPTYFDEVKALAARKAIKCPP